MERTNKRHTDDSALLRPGTMVDHFKVSRLLGRGGMGEVYLARDTQLGRKVALKVVSAEALGDQEAISRFLQEARVTARFSHPHIVAIHSVGEHEGSPYVALEYLPGQTLRQRLDEEQPGLKEALRMGLAIAEAIAEAHSHGVLHRDLKPENVLVPKDGRIRVLDFGLAKALPDSAQTLPDVSMADLAGGGQADAQTVFDTRGGGLRGTPAYMAPEQWAEQPATEATDMWALGLILHELVSGRRPFPTTGFAALCYKVCSPDPVPSVTEAAEGLSGGVVSVIDRCLEKDPAKRPTAADVVESLSDLLADAPLRRSSSGGSPFRGLLPFSERHADRFFGREAEIVAFLERLREEPVLPVVGPSGVGKSSFVQAGIIPRLREQGRWTVLRLRPGRQPFQTLAARLVSGESVARGKGTVIGRTGSSEAAGSTRSEGSAASGDKAEPTEQTSRESRLTARADDEDRLAVELKETPARLSLRLAQLAEAEVSRILLFVDQLEELYTLVDDESVRTAFMQALCWAADDPEGPVRVVFTLRDDFLGRLATGAWPQEALGRVMVLGTPGPEALAEALRRPLEAVGYRFEDPGLVKEMVQAVRGEAAALPLLQFAGRMLWEQRDRERRLLTRNVYETIGGVAGALARHADGEMAGMGPEQERVARQIFLRLVSSEGNRRVVPRSQLLEELGPKAEPVLERLTRARAIIVRKGTAEAELELVHESLIRTWDRLARWLEESREERLFLNEVGQAAALWENRGRPDQEAWQGGALQEALHKAGRCAALPERVRDFLAAGRRMEAGKVRRKRALVALAVGVMGLIALASMAVSWALSKKERKAQQNRLEAVRQRGHAVRQRAEAQREGARSALMRNSLIEARAKLRGSLEIEDSPMARALWWRLKETPLYWEKRLGGIVYNVAFSPDGATVALACQDHTVHLFDVTTGSARLLRGHKDQVFAVRFSPDGRHLASGTWGGVVRIWNLRSESVQVLSGHQAAVNNLAFSPDGRLLASASSDKTVRLWDVMGGRAKAVLEGHRDKVSSVAFSPDGRLLASASFDKSVRLWDVKTGQAGMVLGEHRGKVWSVAFGPGGRLLASASSDGTVRLWDTKTGKKQSVLSGHAAGVYAVGFSPDGQLVVSGGGDRTVRLWRVKTGETRAVMRGHRASIVSVGFSPDGRFIASSSYDRTVRLWHSGRRSAQAAIRGHSQGVVGLSFSADGRWIASGSLDKTVRLWNVETGRVEKVLQGHESGVYATTFSPDGRHVASASTDKTIRVWEIATGQVRAVLRGHAAEVADVSYSLDGRLVASAGFDKTVRLWDSASGRVQRVVRGHGGAVRSVVFSPDGRLLASASFDKTIRVWQTATGNLQKVLSGHQAAVTGVGFGPKGRFVASGSYDKTVRLWDLSTGKMQLVGKHPARIYGLSFHPGGGLLGVAGADGTARIWDLRTRKYRELRGHREEVNFLRFSPDGRLAATSSDDGTVRLWRTKSGWPVWRAPLFLRSSMELFAHGGWVRLDEPSDRSQRTGRWRQAVEQRAGRAVESPNGTLLCIRTHEHVMEMWDLVGDRALARKPLPGLRRVLAVPKGCITLSGGTVSLHDRSAESRVLMDGANSVSENRGEILVSAGKRIHVLGPGGQKRASFPADVGATAMTRTDEWLVVGFENGSMELVPLRKGPSRPVFSFEDVPSSHVTALLPGPMGTIIAGFADGVVGLWSLRNGARLEHDRLHGAVFHLTLKGHKLYAVSELGQHLKWDLGVFYDPYCGFLRQVWKNVPVVWEAGLPARRFPPKDHKCANR